MAMGLLKKKYIADSLCFSKYCVSLHPFHFLMYNLKLIIMKKFVFFATLACVLASCSSDNGEELSKKELVTITFSPYSMNEMTRTATSISTVVTRLDVWIMEGGNTTAVHQSSSDDGFGLLSVTLDRTKTYTLYAVGHKCAEPATLSDGVVSFPDDKVTHSLWYTTTFSPATTTNLSCLMTRIVADFRLEITDNIPTSAVKFRFTIASVFDRWNVSTGGTHSLDRVSTINCNGTSAIFNVYAIVTDASTTHDILVEALDENDGVVKSRTFADVPLRNGYRTNYSGAFFIDQPVSASFLVDDWSDYDTVNF